MDLVLTVLQDPRDDQGYVSGFAITDTLIVAAGGLTRSATMLGSSNARRFEPLATPGALGIRDVLAVGDSLWLCGEYGLLAVSRDRGESWKAFDTDTRGCLFGLALAPSGAIWVVGDAGYVARLHGERPERVDFGTTARLSRVYALRDEIIVLGYDGAIRRWTEQGVTVATPGTTKGLTALAITPRNTWIVIGDGGFVARSPDGIWYSRVTTHVQVDLEGLGQTRDGTLVVVGDHGQILTSSDDGRAWSVLKNELTTHLWSVRRFGSGVLIGGDQGMVIKLAPPGDGTWSDRVDVFKTTRSMNEVFASGPLGFIMGGLAAFLDSEPTEAPDGNVAAEADDPGELDDDGEPIDQEAFRLLEVAGTPADFQQVYGVAMPDEATRFFELTAGHDRWNTFEELRLDNTLRPDVGEHNLFELMVRRNQQAYLGTDLVEAFCGVFGIGSQGNGDTYHMEVYEWDGPRQVLHFDHETATFSGVFADSLDSLVYLASLVKVGEAKAMSRDAYATGLHALHGRISPTWHFGIDDKDPNFVKLEPKRRDSEFFFYRSRWICALLKNDGVVDLADIPELFAADFNQTIPEDQLPARFDACERYIPTALYAMWRAYLFDEPELARYLEIGRAHAARLVRDAAILIDALLAGRNELGTIKDVRAWLAGFRALDLDPRRAQARAEEAAARAAVDAERKAAVVAELAQTPEGEWAALAWGWMSDGVAHRALLEQLDRTAHAATQIAALDELREMSEDEREIIMPRLATELAPSLEALLIGSLVRDDKLDQVLERPPAGGDDVPAAPDEAPVAVDDDVDDVDDLDDDDDEDDDDDAPSAAQLVAAIAMTERALRLAPSDPDAQLTHAMLLIDAERAGVIGKSAELLEVLPAYSSTVRISVAIRLGATGDERFRDAVDLALGEPLPERILTDRTVVLGGASMASFGDVMKELLGELGETVLEHAPDRMSRLVARLPDDVSLLSDLAEKAIQADQRDSAVALYDRMLALSIPDEGDERQNYLRALNNACIQAHGAKAFDAAARIANRVQPVAHENPYIFHSAACAYVAIGDLPKALEQIRLAFDHEYDHLSKVEVDPDLGALLEWPEFKALFRDWRAHQEGN